MSANTFALIVREREIAVIAFVLFCILVVLLVCGFANEFVFRMDPQRGQILFPIELASAGHSRGVLWFFRHENGCPLDVIANVLGHDNLDIAAHYAQVSTRLMMKTYNAAHPHARKVADV